MGKEQIHVAVYRFETCAFMSQMTDFSETNITTKFVWILGGQLFSFFHVLPTPHITCLSSQLSILIHYFSLHYSTYSHFGSYPTHKPTISRFNDLKDTTPAVIFVILN